MRIFIIVAVCFSNFAFCQLDEPKYRIDSRLISTKIQPKNIGSFREEIKLTNISLDTVKIWYNSKNLAKLIAVTNNKTGIDSDYFDRLSTHFNIGFKSTNTLKINNQEFFYDSKRKKLIIKIYSEITKNKLIEVQLISDYDLITNKLPEVKNW
jgi:hypothetical protein